MKRSSSALSIVYRPVTDLLPHPNNTRKHPKVQIRQIAESIRAFGFVAPVVVDGKNRIVAGHGRVEAAKMLALQKVPTVLLENLNDDQVRGYLLADNKIAESAGWDTAALAIELQYLLTTDVDITVLGFDAPEVDLLVQDSKTTEDPDDDLVFDGSIQPVTQHGDLWLMNEHRVFCGDALEEASYELLLEGRNVDVVFLDPPYNVRIQGNTSGHGRTRYREFVMGSSEMTEAEFVTFLTTAFDLAARCSVSGAIHFICMDWRHLGEVLTAGRKTYDALLNLCVWVKHGGGLGSFYKSRHELVFVYKSGKGRHRNNIQLGRFGRERSNVWEYSRVNTRSTASDDETPVVHPTLKPVTLVADALLDCSARGDAVLDSFLGSGSTLLAAQRVGRACFGIEIDQRYVDLTIRRWQHHTGAPAIHMASGQTFDELSATSEDHRG